MSSLNDIPKGPHFAIVWVKSVTVDNHWEEYTDRFLMYKAYANRDEWEYEIAKLSMNTTPFRAFVVTPAEVTVSVSTTTIKMPNCVV